LCLPEAALSPVTKGKSIDFKGTQIDQNH